MKTYYIRTRQGEIVIDSDNTNNGFGPLNKRNLKEAIEAMLIGRESTLSILKKEKREEKEEFEYLHELEKEKSIRLNLKRRAKNRIIEDEIAIIVGFEKVWARSVPLGGLQELRQTLRIENPESHDPVILETIRATQKEVRARIKEIESWIDYNRYRY